MRPRDSPSWRRRRIVLSVARRFACVMLARPVHVTISCSRCTTRRRRPASHRRWRSLSIASLPVASRCGAPVSQQMCRRRFANPSFLAKRSRLAIGSKRVESRHGRRATTSSLRVPRDHRALPQRRCSMRPSWREHLGLSCPKRSRRPRPLEAWRSSGRNGNRPRRAWGVAPHRPRNRRRPAWPRDERGKS